MPGTFAVQRGAWHRVVRLSLPNGWLDETTWANAPQQLKKLFRDEQPAAQAEPAAQAAPHRVRPVRPARLIAAAL